MLCSFTRSLELYYPHFPTEQDFIHSVLSSGDICSYTQKGELYLLGRFAQEWPRLQAGGLLLPDLVKFYQWLHTALGKHHATAVSCCMVTEYMYKCMLFCKHQQTHISTPGDKGACKIPSNWACGGAGSAEV